MATAIRPSEMLGKNPRDFSIVDRLAHLGMAAANPMELTYRSADTADILIATVLDLEASYPGKSAGRAYFESNMARFVTESDAAMLCRATDRMRQDKDPPDWLSWKLMDLLRDQGYLWGTLEVITRNGKYRQLQLRLDNVVWIQHAQRRWTLKLEAGDLVAVRERDDYQVVKESDPVVRATRIIPLTGQEPVRKK